MDNLKKEQKALFEKLGNLECEIFADQSRFLNKLRQFIKEKNLKIDLDMDMEMDLEAAEKHLFEALDYYREIIELVFDVYSHKVSGGQNPAKEHFND